MLNGSQTQKSSLLKIEIIYVFGIPSKILIKSRFITSKEMLKKSKEFKERRRSSWMKEEDKGMRSQLPISFTNILYLEVPISKTCKFWSRPNQIKPLNLPKVTACKWTSLNRIINSNNRFNNNKLSKNLSINNNSK